MRIDDSQRSLYAALGRVPSGLFIVTMRHENKETGMLASWVQQCSFTPPLITLGVAPGRALAAWMTDGARFVVNILHESQTDMIAHFGKGFAPDADAFAGLEVERGQAAAPILSEIVAYLDCRIVNTAAPGDHTLVIAEVIDGRVKSEGHAMVHIRKSGAHY